MLNSRIGSHTDHQSDSLIGPDDKETKKLARTSHLDGQEGTISPCSEHFEQ